MMMEWIEGDTIRDSLNHWLNARKDFLKDGIEWRDAPKAQSEEVVIELMRKIGRAIGKMHSIGIVHGDLTTSNLMLRKAKGDMGLETDNTPPLTATDPSLDGDVVLIDFGLATQSVQDEDKAVDLYVLERAFGSTHPTVEKVFNDLLTEYGLSYKGALVVLKRLEDVRMRGRKRSMLG